MALSQERLKEMLTLSEAAAAYDAAARKIHGQFARLNGGA